jgi:hypothetical protein
VSTYVLSSRNVNDALTGLVAISKNERWRRISPRGMETLEYKGTFVTEYERPLERVLFNPARDANPFFHFMEALWILAGRQDVEFLKQFSSNISNFSDDGKRFHAAYGQRMRNHFWSPGLRTDQLIGVIELLRKEPDTRRAVMCFWDPRTDLGVYTDIGFEHVTSKDIPCNDLLMFKLRDDELNLTVCCRSNDAVWGAYGANAVQFATILEFVAAAVGVKVGTYRQISDSFHIYTDNEAWKRVVSASAGQDEECAYTKEEVSVFPLKSVHTPYVEWLRQCELFCNLQLGIPDNIDPYFEHVAYPIYGAWRLYKRKGIAKEINATHAIKLLQTCAATDWRRACIEWIQRRTPNTEQAEDTNFVLPA